MTFRIDISAGEAFELLRPAALAASSIVSTIVFASARKRFSLIPSLAWAILTLSLPLIVAPLYFAFIILRPRPVRSLERGRWLIPSAYAAILLGCVALLLVFQNRSADAHFFRANQARLRHDSTRTIQEYRAALTREDNAHTHKLLAIELAEAGRLQEAVTEFRLAEQGGEDDDSIHFRLGESLEKLQQVSEAATEYQKFLNSNSCVKAEKDSRCEEALQKLHK